jgi:hypothetical protein
VENFETILHQDLNGDGTIGIRPATSPAGVQLAAGQASQITFHGHAPTPQAASTISGPIIGFTGDGTIGGSDRIDLHGIHFNALHSDASGTLSVSDRSTTASLQFLGHAQDNFHFAGDSGNGGTVVLAVTAAVQGGTASVDTIAAEPYA